MKCNHCGADIQKEGAKFCPKCGKSLQAQEVQKQPIPSVAKSAVPIKEVPAKTGIGAIWPEWEIEPKPIGKGSFGSVYKAVRRDHNVESYAAIKVITIPADSSEVDSLRSEGLDMNATRTYLQGIVNDFVSEIQLMESLKGVQNIVSVEDYKVVEKTDEIGWDIYIRMELLTPFNTYLGGKTLSEEEVIKLGCDICTALEICGKRNIIHRDIKPENIFINDFGYFKLGDFGIARKMENLTGGLSSKGTFNYMAPEVANSSEYDARVDTYSLGIVLYRLLNNNRLPFLDTEKQLLNPNERKQAVERRIRGEELPVPCNASPAMANLILRACAFDPAMRFVSATEMKQALESVASGTYQIVAVDVDKTTSVRKAQADPDKTTSVRKAPVTDSKKEEQPVSTFGTAKKKSKLPVLIAAILAVVVLIGAGIFALPKLLGDNGNNSTSGNDSTTGAADYSKQDEEQIASIIADAELLAAEADYEGALTKVQTGLITYPNSKDLQDKADEYVALLNSEAVSTTDSENQSTTAATTPEPVLPTNILLSSLNVVDSSGCTYWNTGKPVDPFGNNYANKENFIIFDSSQGMDWKSSFHTYNAYAEYRLDGKAESISGWIVPYNSCKEGATAYVQIYADDILLYTSPYITRKTDPFQFDVAITGAEYVKLCVVLENDGSYYWFGEYPYYSSLILFDVLLSTASSPLADNATEPITSLATQNIFNSSGWPEWNEGYPKDYSNSDYTSANNYAIFESSRDMDFRGEDHTYTAFAEYKVDGEYSSMVGTIATYTTAKPDSVGYVQVYADDVLIYTSAEINGKSDPIPFEVDLTDVKYIKIVVVLENDGSYYWHGEYDFYSALILSDIMFKP